MKAEDTDNSDNVDTIQPSVAVDATLSSESQEGGSNANNAKTVDPSATNYTKIQYSESGEAVPGANNTIPATPLAPISVAVPLDESGGN